MAYDVKSNRNCLQLDWFSFVFKVDWLPEKLVYKNQWYDKESFLYSIDYDESKDTDFDVFMQLFPEIMIYRSEFFIWDRRRHYSSALALDNEFFIFYDEKQTNKGVSVEVPSHGLWRLMDWFSGAMEFYNADPRRSDKLYTLIKLLADRGAKPSRLDFALDIPKDLCPFMPLDLWKLYDAGQIVSHSRSVDAGNFKQKKFSYLDCDGQYISSDRGTTFYLGSLKSRQKLLRVYDKCAESKGINNSIRFELEYHSRFARGIADEILDHDIAFSDLLEEFCYVCVGDDVSSDEKRSRRPRLPEWDRFIREFVAPSETQVSRNVVFPKKTKYTNLDSSFSYFNDCKLAIMIHYYTGHKELFKDFYRLSWKDNFIKACKDAGRDDLISALENYELNYAD